MKLLESLPPDTGLTFSPYAIAVVVAGVTGLLVHRAFGFISIACGVGLLVFSGTLTVFGRMTFGGAALVFIVAMAFIGWVLLPELVRRKRSPAAPPVSSDRYSPPETE